MVCCESHHRFEDEILASITHYVKKNSGSIDLLESLMKILYGENLLFRLEHRLNALEKLLVTIGTAVRKSTLTEFYNKHLETPLEVTPPMLMNKIVSFRLLDVMCSILKKDDLFGVQSATKQDEAKKLLRLDTSMIKLGATFDGQELTQYIIARARAQTIDRCREKGEAEEFGPVVGHRLVQLSDLGADLHPNRSETVQSLSLRCQSNER